MFPNLQILGDIITRIKYECSVILTIYQFITKNYLSFKGYVSILAIYIKIYIYI